MTISGSIVFNLNNQTRLIEEIFARLMALDLIMHSKLMYCCFSFLFRTKVLWHVRPRTRLSYCPHQYSHSVKELIHTCILQCVYFRNRSHDLPLCLKYIYLIIFINFPLELILHYQKEQFAELNLKYVDAALVLDRMMSDYMICVLPFQYMLLPIADESHYCT